MRKYVYKKKDGYSKPVGLAKLMAVAALRLVAGAGPFSITQDGDPITGALSRTDALSRLKQAVSSREIGPVFRVRKGNGKVVFACRAVRIEETIPTTDSTNGNSHADLYYNWVYALFRAYDPRYAGAYVCKRIAGSTTLSQHSYGNAVDFFFDSLTDQERVFEAVVRGDFTRVTGVRVAHAISRDRIWNPDTGMQHYGGDYHSHLHVDFLPQFSGGCGVREP